MTELIHTTALFVGEDRVVQLYAGTELVWPLSGPVPIPPLLSASVLPAPTFPITIRADGRGFRDAANKPFIGVGDTIWNAMSRMTLAEWTSYINTRRSQGFTSVLVSMLDINSRTRTQVTTGVTPFSGTGNAADFTAPNQVYFDAVKAKLDVAQTAGVLVWIVPGWYGYLGDRWRPNWAASATDFTKADSYAAYLAAQFGSRTGIAWLHGGDNNPDTANNATDNSSVKVSLVDVTNRFANALRSASAVSQLATYHTGRTFNAADWFAGQPWFVVNAAYAGTDVPAETIVEWARGGPVTLTEAHYENRATVGLGPPNLTRLQVRNVAYHALFTGALMYANGNEVVWPVREVYGSWVWDDATYGVTSVGAQDHKILSRIMASLPKRWAADASSPLVTVNRGTGTTLSPGLLATDNTAAMIYVPAAKTITVKHSAIAAPKGGLWVNPQTAVTTVAKLGSGSSSTLTVPSGWADAVLLINANDPQATPTGGKWADFPPGWTWEMFDPSVAWSDLTP